VDLQCTDLTSGGKGRNILSKSSKSRSRSKFWISLRKYLIRLKILLRLSHRINLSLSIERG
jgi:hypothetical protein